MITLHLIAAALIALMLTCDIFILVRPRLSVKKYLIFLLSFSALFFIQDYWGFFPMLFVILAVNSILLAKFTKKLYSVFYVPLGYIVNCIFINLTGLAFNLLWDISTKDVNADALLLSVFALCTIAASCPVLSVARRLLEKYLGDTLEKLNRKLLALVALTLLLCAFMLFTMASFFDYVEISHREYLLTAASLVLYCLYNGVKTLALRRNL